MLCPLLEVAVRSSPTILKYRVSIPDSMPVPQAMKNSGNFT